MVSPLGFIGRALLGAVVGAVVFNLITLFRLIIRGFEVELEVVLFVSAIGAFFGLGYGFTYLFRQIDAAIKGIVPDFAKT